MSEDFSKVTAIKKRTTKLFFSKRSAAAPDLGSPWLVILNVVLIFIASQFIAAFITEVFIALAGKTGLALDNSPGFELMYVLLAEGLAVLAVLRLVRGRGLGLATIGLGRKPKWTDAGGAIVGFAVFYALLIIVSIVLNILLPSAEKGTQDVGFNNIHGALAGAVAFVALVIIPPLGEEPLIRGYLYSGLRMRLRYVPALIITSLIFGAAHLDTGATTSLLWSAAINTFILSVVLVYLRERTGALYAGMLVHALNNTIAFGVHFHGIIF